MIVGSLRVRLIVRDSRTLKDKRQVVRSIKDKLRDAFNVSVAEVDYEDDCKMVALGLAMVSNEASHVKGAFEQVLAALRAHPVAEFVDFEMEV